MSNGGIGALMQGVESNLGDLRRGEKRPTAPPIPDELMEALASQIYVAEKDAIVRNQLLQKAQTQTQGTPPTITGQTDQRAMNHIRNDLAQHVGAVGKNKEMQQKKRLQQLLKSGIGSQSGGGPRMASGPRMAGSGPRMAGGGIVSFQDGGSTNAEAVAAEWLTNQGVNPNTYSSIDLYDLGNKILSQQARGGFFGEIDYGKELTLQDPRDRAARGLSSRELRRLQAEQRAMDEASGIGADSRLKMAAKSLRDTLIGTENKPSSITSGIVSVAEDATGRGRDDGRGWLDRWGDFAGNKLYDGRGWLPATYDDRGWLDRWGVPFSASAVYPPKDPNFMHGLGAGLRRDINILGGAAYDASEAVRKAWEDISAGYAGEALPTDAERDAARSAELAARRREAANPETVNLAEDIAAQMARKRREAANPETVNLAEDIASQTSITAATDAEIPIATPATPEAWVQSWIRNMADRKHAAATAGKNTSGIVNGIPKPSTIEGEPPRELSRLERLRKERDEMRAEMEDPKRQTWQRIMAGLSQAGEEGLGGYAEGSRAERQRQEEQMLEGRETALEREEMNQAQLDVVTRQIWGRLEEVRQRYIGEENLTDQAYIDELLALIESGALKEFEDRVAALKEEHTIDEWGWWNPPEIQASFRDAYLNLLDTYIAEQMTARKRASASSTPSGETLTNPVAYSGRAPAPAPSGVVVEAADYFR